MSYTQNEADLKQRERGADTELVDEEELEMEPKAEVVDINDAPFMQELRIGIQRKHRKSKRPGWTAFGSSFMLLILLLAVFGFILGDWASDENAQSLAYFTGFNSFTNNWIRFCILFDIIGVGVFFIFLLISWYTLVPVLMIGMTFSIDKHVEATGIERAETEEALTRDIVIVHKTLLFVCLGFMSAGMVCVLLGAIFHIVASSATGQGYTPNEQNFALWCAVNEFITLGLGLGILIAIGLMYIYAQEYLVFVNGVLETELAKTNGWPNPYDEISRRLQTSFAKAGRQLNKPRQVQVPFKDTSSTSEMKTRITMKQLQAINKLKARLGQKTHVV